MYSNAVLVFLKTNEFFCGKNSQLNPQKWKKEQKRIECELKCITAKNYEIFKQSSNKTEYFRFKKAVFRHFQTNIKKHKKTFFMVRSKIYQSKCLKKQKKQNTKLNEK